MKAVVFHGVGEIRVEEVSEPTLQQGTDAIVRLTASAICGIIYVFERRTQYGGGIRSEVAQRGFLLAH